ncbi:MAG: hypothetical protein WCO55_05865 [Candidatus Falkowbacteria bacterium]
MLDKLFGSNARVKLLKLFLLHPDQRYYIREIARELDLQLNSVFRELNNLEEMGLLLSESGPEPEEEPVWAMPEPEEEPKKKGRAKVKDADKEVKKSERKYYRANTEFILFNEIKALIVKSQMLYEKDFTDKLKKVGDIQLLVLSGFFVANASSPIDLLVVGDLNKKKLTKVIQELESELIKEVNYAIMTEQEFSYRREIADVFLYTILDGDKLVVVDREGIL